MESIRVSFQYEMKMKNRVNYNHLRFSDKNKTKYREINEFLTPNDISVRYGPPNWIGRKQTLLGLKTQWFYQLGAGKIRYVFFIDDQVIWDWIITEQKMLDVVYPDNELVT